MIGPRSDTLMNTKTYEAVTLSCVKRLFTLFQVRHAASASILIKPLVSEDPRWRRFTPRTKAGLDKKKRIGNPNVVRYNRSSIDQG